LRWGDSSTLPIVFFRFSGTGDKKIYGGGSVESRRRASLFEGSRVRTV
jgi:hypothetical protein